MATTKDTPKSPEAATTAATTETACNNVRLGYSATLADRVLYADGVHGIALRGGVAQIDLYQVITPGNDKQPEQRVISQRLALPLSALNELAGILGRINQSVSSAQAAAKAKQA